MSKTYAVVRPDPAAWSAIPRSVSGARQTVIAWLIVVGTTVAAFIAERGWEELSPEELLERFRVIDMFGMSATLIALLFAAFGWLLGRMAVTAAPIVLVYAAVPNTLVGSGSALFWWIGAALAIWWWLAQARIATRQLHEVRALAERSNTSERLELGPIATGALRRIERRTTSWGIGLSVVAILGWAAAFRMLPNELGRRINDGDLTSLDGLSLVAAGLTVLALVQWHRCGWRSLARRRVGDLVWHVPIDGGPVLGLWMTPSQGAGTLAIAEAQKSDRCSCLEEYSRLDPDELEEFREAFGFLTSAYCPVHGIDAINTLTIEQFLVNADNAWLWDSHSLLPMPLPTVATSTFIIGYSGDFFTGVIGRVEDGTAECYEGFKSLIEQSDRQTIEFERQRPLHPIGGVLDMIDLAPAGLGGRAVRYRHGRAWLDTSEDSNPAG